MPDPTPNKAEVIAWLIAEAVKYSKTPKEKINDQTKFLEDLEIDSLDLSVILMAAEDFFVVEIHNSAEPRTIEAFADIVLSEIQKQSEL